MRAGISLKQGFTIVELLIVVVVIAILAAITIVSYNGITKSANEAAAKAELSSLNKAVEMYRQEHGNLPLCDRASDSVPEWNPGWGCSWAQVSHKIPNLKTNKFAAYVSSNSGSGSWAVVVKMGNVRCKAGVNMHSSWWVQHEPCWP